MKQNENTDKEIKQAEEKLRKITDTLLKGLVVWVTILTLILTYHICQ